MSTVIDLTLSTPGRLGFFPNTNVYGVYPKLFDNEFIDKANDCSIVTYEIQNGSLTPQSQRMRSKLWLKS